MYRLLETPRPSTDLGVWESVVGPFTRVVGWTFFGDFFLRNPDDGYYAMLIVSEPRIVAMRYNDRASFEGLLLRPGFVEQRLRRADVQALEGRLGVLGPSEVFVPATLSPPDEVELDTYRVGDVWQYASFAAACHAMGEGAAMDSLLRHLRLNDDTALWRVALEHILGELPRTPGTPGRLVQVGRCSHWLRPHQTRWTADGGFAWPTGYGSGGGGYSRTALPQFDWSVVLAWTGERWEPAADKAAKPALRVAIPSRTMWHQQAAVHTIWMTAKEKERRFYGFRKKSGVWRCTAESEWREDRKAERPERTRRPRRSHLNTTIRRATWPSTR